MRSYRAVYPYTPQRDDELRICQNDFLHHVSHVSDDWVMVRNTIGQEGLVPCTYITHVSTLPTPWLDLGPVFLFSTYRKLR